MSAAGRLAAGVLGAAAVIAAGLAWWQWPLGLAPAARQSPPATQQAQAELPTDAGQQAQAARIAELRRAIERELEALEQARSRQAGTEAELKALQQSLEQRRDRVERLQRRLHDGGGDGDS